MCREVFHVAYVLLALSVGVFSHNVTDTHAHAHTHTAHVFHPNTHTCSLADTHSPTQ